MEERELVWDWVWRVCGWLQFRFLSCGLIKIWELCCKILKFSGINLIFLVQFSISWLLPSLSQRTPECFEIICANTITIGTFTSENCGKYYIWNQYKVIVNVNYNWTIKLKGARLPYQIIQNQHCSMAVPFKEERSAAERSTEEQRDSGWVQDV